MSADSFRNCALEQLSPLEGLRYRQMFGGYGLYGGEQPFGIFYDGRLFFKTFPATLQQYMEHHAAIFAPSEKQVFENYRDVPVDILEDSERLLLWTSTAALQ
jgi:DNA transformation protein